VRFSDPARDFVGELVPEQTRAVERVPDRSANRLHVFPSDLRVKDAVGIPPSRQFARRAGDGSPGGMPETELTGGM
jgi:hypothetical protein